MFLETDTKQKYFNPKCGAYMHTYIQYICIYMRERMSIRKLIRDSCHDVECHRRHTGGVEVQVHSFLTSVLNGVDDQSRFTLGKETPTHCRGGWEGPMANLDGEYLLSLPRFDLRTLQPVTSRYPGPNDNYN
jgi:hypothetical protein